MSKSATLLQLAQGNPLFQQWVKEVVSNTNPVRTFTLLYDGDQFRPLLLPSEEERFDSFFRDGGPLPDWVNVCRQNQNPLENVQKITAINKMTVMCDACGNAQPMGTKCFKTGNYHM